MGIWVMEQRQVYKARKLSKERIDVLKEIGFEWVRVNQYGCILGNFENTRNTCSFVTFG